jgi:hypothetical protein
VWRNGRAFRIPYEVAIEWQGPLRRGKKHLVVASALAAALPPKRKSRVASE